MNDGQSHIVTDLARTDRLLAAARAFLDEVEAVDGERIASNPTPEAAHFSRCSSALQILLGAMRTKGDETGATAKATIAGAGCGLASSLWQGGPEIGFLASAIFAEGWDEGKRRILELMTPQGSA